MDFFDVFSIYSKSKMYKSKIEIEATQHNTVQDLKFLK